MTELTELELSALLERVGADTLLVAFAVAFAVWGIKKVAPKLCKNTPFVTILPFALGVLLFALLQCVLHPSLEYIGGELVYIFRRGFTAGCLSALVGNIIAKAQGKSFLSPKGAVVRELLTGFVAEEKLCALAESIAGAVSKEYTQTDIDLVKETLKEELYDESEDSENDLKVLATLIVKALKASGL